MNGVTPIIVKRGFLSSLVSGVAGVVITVVLCGSGVGLYALNIVDRKIDHAVGIGRDVVEALPRLKDSLPPLLADALNDQREPAYRAKLEVTARIAANAARRDHGDDHEQRSRILVTVKNNGADTVSLLALRLNLLDGGGVPVRQLVRYAATPIAADGDLPGPLLPGGGERILAVEASAHDAFENVQVEVADVRVWRPQPTEAAKVASSSVADEKTAP